MVETVSCCAPILLLGFNRADFMAEQITAIRGVKPSRLYVAVDGPRADRPGEAELCRKVRDCVNLVDWPCEIKTLFREENLFSRHMDVWGWASWRRVWRDYDVDITKNGDKIYEMIDDLDAKCPRLSVLISGIGGILEKILPFLFRL